MFVSTSGVGPVVGLYSDWTTNRKNVVWYVPLDKRKCDLKSSIEYKVTVILTLDILHYKGNHFRTFDYTVKMSMYEYSFA